VISGSWLGDDMTDLEDEEKIPPLLIYPSTHWPFHCITWIRALEVI